MPLPTRARVMRGDPRRTPVHGGRRASRRRRRSSSRRPRARHGVARGRSARRRRAGDAARPQQRAGRVHGHGVERDASVARPRTAEQDFTLTAPAGTGRLPGRDPATAPRGARRRPPWPWIRSNPIYVRGADGAAARRRRGRRRRSREPIFDGSDRRRWRAEHDPTSLAAVEVVPMRRRRRAAASATGWPAATRRGQFAALAVDTPGGLAAHDRLTFTDRAERPMRISVQLRVGDAGRVAGALAALGLRRHRRSRSARSTSTTCTPVGDTHTAARRSPTIRSIVFVDRRDELRSRGCRGGCGSGKWSCSDDASADVTRSAVRRHGRCLVSGCSAHVRTVSTMSIQRRRRRTGCSAPMRPASATSSRRRRARRRCSARSSRRSPARSRRRSP